MEKLHSYSHMMCLAVYLSLSHTHKIVFYLVDIILFTLVGKYGYNNTFHLFSDHETYLSPMCQITEPTDCRSTINWPDESYSVDGFLMIWTEPSRTHFILRNRIHNYHVLIMKIISPSHDSIRGVKKNICHLYVLFSPKSSWH